MLTANNPAAPKNLVRFNMKVRRHLCLGQHPAVTTGGWLAALGSTQCLVRWHMALVSWSLCQALPLPGKRHPRAWQSHPGLYSIQQLATVNRTSLLHAKFSCHLLASAPLFFHLCSFGLQERTFKSEPMVEQLMVHYSTDGFLLHRGSEEARRQLEAEKAADDAANRFQAEVGSRRGCGRAGVACCTSPAQMHCSAVCSIWEAEGCISSVSAASNCCGGIAPAPAMPGRQKQGSCCGLLLLAAKALPVCFRPVEGRMAAAPHQRCAWPLLTHFWDMGGAGQSCRWQAAALQQTQFHYKAPAAGGQGPQGQTGGGHRRRWP